jgi:putative hydrolase of the HAD superfamily
MERPKVIFLDAVGTLFGIRGSVGEIYSAIALSMAGVEISAPSLDRAFRQSFKNSKPLAFSQVNEELIPKLEYQWWRAIVKETLTEAGVIDKFLDFEQFFAQLYAYFATPAPWYIYPEVVFTLKNWQKLGIELGIISNFDTRLDQVIESLELKQYFSSFTISSMVGAAKPEGKIFMAALEKHNCQPLQAWHIGDSLKEDYYGAKAVGITAFWLQRLPGRNTKEI